jgi:hypothetical protein
MRLLLQLLLISIQLLVYKGQPTPIPEHQLQPFEYHPSHLQYIEDSIQPPIPQRPIEIQVHQTVLNPLTVATAHQLSDHLFLIRINLMHQPLWYFTMHHELVHIKQMVRKDLDLRQDTWYWKGQPADWTIPYPYRPWEVQADLQAQMYIDLYQTTH